MSKAGARAEMVAIEHLREPGDDLYPRQKIRKEVVDRYRENVDDLPAIEVARSDDAVLNNTIRDGRHRFRAVKAEGRREIPCMFVEVSSEGEFLAEAARSNSAHGLPLSAEERRAVAERLWGVGHDKEAIATATGRSVRTIERWLKPLEDKRDREIVDKIVDAYDRSKDMTFAKVKEELGLDVDPSTIGKWYRERKAESSNGGSAGPTSTRGAKKDAGADGKNHMSSPEEQEARTNQESGEAARARGQERRETQIKSVVEILYKARLVVEDLAEGEPCKPSEHAELTSVLLDLQSALQDLMDAGGLRVGRGQDKSTRTL